MVAEENEDYTESTTQDSATKEVLSLVTVKTKLTEIAALDRLVDDKPGSID